MQGIISNNSLKPQFLKPQVHSPERAITTSCCAPLSASYARPTWNRTLSATASSASLLTLTCLFSSKWRPILITHFPGPPQPATSSPCSSSPCWGPTWEISAGGSELSNSCKPKQNISLRVVFYICNKWFLWLLNAPMMCWHLATPTSCLVYIADCMLFTNIIP